MDTAKSDTSLRNKRERSPPEKDDDMDIRPLSKRMNRLNLSESFNEITRKTERSLSSRAIDAKENASSSDKPKGDHNRPILNSTSNLVEGGRGDIQLKLPQYMPSHLFATPAKITQGQAGSKKIQNPDNIDTRDDDDSQPEPGLLRNEPFMDKESNPVYYESNCLLFQLHLERISRNRMRPHPDLLRGSGDGDASCLNC